MVAVVYGGETTLGKNTFDVSAETFEQDVLNSEKPVLVDFWAEWCAPCKMIAPIVDELSVEYAEKLRVAKLDTDANPILLDQYGVMGIPTLILFKGGEPVMRSTGFRSKDDLVNKIIPHLA